MKIAVTGTHGSGKTTLIDDFTDARRDYDRELEPYWALAQQGIPFSDGVTLPELEEQLNASSRMILTRRDEPNVIFDRSPLDFIAYLEVVAEGEGAEWEPSGRQLGQIERALSALDLLVLLPLTEPDEIAVSIELPRLRRAVDRRLRQIVLDDQLGLVEGLQVLVLRGSRSERCGALVRRAAG